MNPSIRFKPRDIQEIGFKRFQAHETVYDVFGFADKKKRKIWAKKDIQATCANYRKNGWNTMAQMLEEKGSHHIAIDWPLRIFNPEKNFKKL